MTYSTRLGQGMVDTYLTIAEAAAVLKESPRTVRTRIKEGRLPAYRVGPHHVRIKADDLERLFQPIRVDEPVATVTP